MPTDLAKQPNPTPGHCVFCAIAWDRSRSQVAVSTLGGEPTVVTFVPLNPVTPGHRLFVPVDHYDDAVGMPSCLLGDCFSAAASWGAQMAGRGPGAFNLITSRGVLATQSVFHTHVHLVPRRRDDGLHLPWTGQRELDS